MRMGVIQGWLGRLREGMMMRRRCGIWGMERATFKIGDEDDDDEDDDTDEDHDQDKTREPTQNESTTGSDTLDLPRRSQRIRSRSPHQRTPSDQ